VRVLHNHVSMNPVMTIALRGWVVSSLVLASACTVGGPDDGDDLDGLEFSPGQSTYRDSPWINMPLDIDGAYSHVGVDIAVDDYHPCVNPSDPGYAACPVFSYFLVQGQGSFPYGLFIENQTLVNGSMIKHDFAKKVTWAAAEIYTHRCTSYGDLTTGGMRVEADFSRSYTAEPLYSNPIAPVRLPQKGDLDATWINGFVWGDSGPWFDGVTAAIEPECSAKPAPRVSIDVFQLAMPMSFASVAARRTDGEQVDGRDFAWWSSGPIKQGKFKLYIGDRLTDRKVAMIMDARNRDGIRLDIDLSYANLCEQYAWSEACFTCKSYNDCSGLPF
jgi:hypothetical protein